MCFHFVEQGTLHLLLFTQSGIDTFFDGCSFEAYNKVIHLLSGAVDTPVGLLKGFVRCDAAVPDDCAGSCKREPV